MARCCVACCQSVNIWITIAALGFIAGITAGPMFAFEFHNINAAVFAFISSFIALILLILHIRHKRNSLIRWLEYLRYFTLVGFWLQLLAILLFVVYITLAIINHQDLSQVRGENLYVASVWIWMTWKWSFSVFWFSRKYKGIYDNSLIIDCERQNQDQYGNIDP